MADVTITELSNLTPSGSLYVPISNGTTTGKTQLSSIPVDYSNITNKPTQQLPFAWCSFLGRDSNGVCTLNSQYNISSVSRTSNGNYTANFTTSFTGFAMLIGTAAGRTSVSYNAPIWGSSNNGVNISFNVPLLNGSNTGLYDPINGANIVIYV